MLCLSFVVQTHTYACSSTLYFFVLFVASYPAAAMDTGLSLLLLQYYLSKDSNEHGIDRVEQHYTYMNIKFYYLYSFPWT
jgi:hypothetical protein